MVEQPDLGLHFLPIFQKKDARLKCMWVNWVGHCKTYWRNSSITYFFLCYLHAFLKGYCNRIHPSIRPSVTLSPPKLLDEIQPNLMSELLTWMGHATAQFLGARPLGPWGGAKLGYWGWGIKDIFPKFNQIWCPNLSNVSWQGNKKIHQNTIWNKGNGPQTQTSELNRKQSC